MTSVLALSGSGPDWSSAERAIAKGLAGIVALAAFWAPVHAQQPPATGTGASPAQALQAIEQAAAEGNHERVVQLLEKLLPPGAAPARESAEASDPIDSQRARPSDRELARLFYLRARSRFCLGQLESALADFDRVVELAADRERELWERGIVQYYLGKYAEGSRQFELYQTYYDQDVENSVWRYLCQVPNQGVDAARDQLLPIDHDARVPLMEVYRLFRGESTPARVLSAAERPGSEKQLAQQRFFAHLYLGLYHESLGRPEQSLQHIRRAVEDFGQDHYMWQVARIHMKLRDHAHEGDTGPSSPPDVEGS